MYSKEISIYVFPEKELRSLSPNFHILFERPDRSTYFPAAELADRFLWEYVNRSQKHECRKWDCGRAVPFLWIFVSSFWCCVFAVQVQCEMSQHFFNFQTNIQ